MPLAAAEHLHASVAPFLAGLLPDSAPILERWGKQFGVSPRNAMALLAHVGEDCAGAVRIVRPERRQRVRNVGRGSVAWLSERDVANRLRALRGDPSHSRAPSSISR